MGGGGTQGFLSFFGANNFFTKVLIFTIYKNKKICNNCYISHLKYKALAFTLAEVLITLGIIGVVAAMTLPSLICSWNDKASVVKVKKAYSILNQAYLMSKADNGPVSEWNIEELTDLVPYFTQYIKNIKICNDTNINGCKAMATYDLTGKSYTNNLEYYHFVDASGIAYVFRDNYPVSTADAQKYGGSYIQSSLQMARMYVVIVNINSKKEVLRYGIDTFVFVITDKGIVPYGVIGWQKEQMCNPTTPSSKPGYWNGMGCAGWVISEGNMDYMKCLRGNQKYCERGNYNP